MARARKSTPTSLVKYPRNTLVELAVSPMLRQLTAQHERLIASVTSPALQQLTAQHERLIASVTSPALQQLTAQHERLIASVTFPALQQLTAQSRSITAGLLQSPAWERFAEDFVAHYADTAARIEEMDDPDDFARTAGSVMAGAAVITGAATTEPDEKLETYDFSGLLEPGERVAIQATVAVIVFMQTFAWVVSHYELASELNTLTGVGPLLAAQVAWNLTGRLLASLD